MMDETGIMIMGLAGLALLIIILWAYSKGRKDGYRHGQRVGKAQGAFRGRTEGFREGLSEARKLMMEDDDDEQLE